MKVLQINVTSNWGSTGRIVEDIGNLIKKSGDESYIAYGRNNNPSNSITIKVGNDSEIYFHILATRLLDRHGLASKKGTKELIKEIIKINPDIIHLHNIHGYYLNYKILFEYLSKTNITIVWTLHDCWAYTGHCAFYSYENCNRWKTECHHCPQLKKYPISWYKDRSRKNFIDKLKAFTSIKNMTLVPVSNWLGKEIESSFLKKYPVKVIHNGIDLNVFCPQKPFKTINNIPINDKFVILGVASVWDDRKGLADYIQLRKLLPAEFIIVLIGLNQQQISKLPPGIIGISRTNNSQELAQYYSTADVYANFSVEETFGLTTCESLACGTPVIVYNATACPEIVSEETGYITDIKDFNSIRDKIYAIKNKGKESYSIACRRRAEMLYNKEYCYSQYIKLYKSLICK